MDIHSVIENLVNIHTLWLSYNEDIDQFLPISFLTKLKRLYLRRAGLKDIDFLSELNDLTSLYITDNEISDFLEFFKKEKSLIQVEDGTWIPRVEFGKKPEKGKRLIFLEIEEGVDVEWISRIFSSVSDLFVKEIHYYGSYIPTGFQPGVQILKMNKDFSRCIEYCRITQFFRKIGEDFYALNVKLNSCWGTKLAVTKDNMVRPCIYSEIELGNLKNENIIDILNEAFKYQTITKDKVEKCKDCELRYACFDCREIARRKNGSLYSPNPYCNYDPYKGTWNVSIPSITRRFRHCQCRVSNTPRVI